MIRVLVVDDSAVVRRILTDALGTADDIEVVGTAVDPYSAREKIAALKPDVLTLDIEMPRMDGLTFLEKIMSHHPMPVVVVSSLTPANSPMALRAFALGAVGVVCKPGSQFSVQEVTREVTSQVRAASVARVQVLKPAAAQRPSPKGQPPLITTRQILAIGASTGGPQAIERILVGLPVGCSGTLVVQHMPPQFTAGFAARLSTLCAMKVSEATDGEELLTGKALIAPGGCHVVVQRVGAAYLVRLKDAPPVNYHRPSIDVMMQSIARSAGSNAIGVLLTGMGNDGARGLLAMREAGAFTIAQDEASCVVFGMPKEAVALGAANDVLPLDQIGGAIRTRLAG